MMESEDVLRFLLEKRCGASYFLSCFSLLPEMPLEIVIIVEDHGKKVVLLVVVPS